MEEFIARILENLGLRVTGPMHPRIYIQPLVASVFAVLAGIRDARLGKPPYFWALLTSAEHRAEMLRDGWRSIGRVFLLAVILDIIYQLIVERFIYPLELLITAFILAIVPFLIVRGSVSHIVSLFIHGEKDKRYARDTFK